MAIDNTPPRLRLIATIAIIVIVTLVGLEFVFKSYYAFMTDEAKAEKIAPKTALLAQAKLEAESFGGAKIPIDQAMSQVAKGTRPELIEPKPSDDLSAMTGWAKLPKPAPVALSADGGVLGTAVMAADAGAHDPDAGPIATTTLDGGAAAMDAGAMHAPAVKDAGAHP